MWSEAKARVSHRLATHLSVEPFRLLNETPIVSFTFDDIPKSAATTGARLLEDHDARGTFYVSGGLVGTASSDWAAADAQDIVELHRHGHEIGCHTFSHGGPAISMLNPSPRKSRRIAAICARSTHPSRSATLPIRSVTDRSGARASSSRRSGHAAVSCLA